MLPLPDGQKLAKLRVAMKHQLDFEKPIAELQSKLEELKKHPETHSLGISFEEEVAMIEKKIEETQAADLLQPERLGPDQNRAASQTAVHPGLPASSAFTDFTELHGIAFRGGPRRGRRIRLPWAAQGAWLSARKKAATRRKIFFEISVRRIRKGIARRCA